LRHVSSIMQFGDLRGILQYVPQFRGGTFVIAVDGLVAASENFANVLLDIGVLHSLNINVVLVHGAGHQVREMAAERGVEVSCDDGIGVTDVATLELSIDAISRLTSKLMQRLTSIRLRGVTANAITAHPAGMINGLNLGMTGTIDKVDAKGLQAFLDEGMVPVVAPVGYDSKGGALRLNSDAVAVAVGEALGAQKILFLTHGIARDSDGARVQKLSVIEAEELVDQTDAAGLMGRRLRSILRFAARACAAGVPRVHLLDGMQDEALLGEVFSNEGVGTMVFSDSYDEVRQATESDVAAIVSMIRQSVKDEELLLRNREDVLERLQDYFVLEVDGNPVGTIAVHPFLEDSAAELACLFIRKDHKNLGYGRRLVGFAEKTAREAGAERLFALTTQAGEFFRGLGFEAVTVEVLPEARREKYLASGRNSHVVEKRV
jgi:amino-acid N-acetyltransferase